MVDREDEPRLYTTEEVGVALKLVVDVTLNRVLEALDERTYGVEIRKGDDGNPKIKVVVAWKDVEKAIQELRNKGEE